MRLLTLGGLELRTDEGRSVVAQQKRLALLCYLTLREPGAFVQRHAAASIFWPESTELRARSALRNFLHYLRGLLGAEAIVARGDEEIAIDPQVVWCDAVEFERAYKAGQYEEALALYRGPLLEGFLPAGVPEFTDWLDQRRRSLHRMATDAVRTLADHASERSSAGAVSWVQRWIELSPYEEPAIRALMQVLSASGNRAQAIDAFDAWSERLARDLNAQPSAETLRLADGIRSSAQPRAAQKQIARPDVSPAAAPVVPPRRIRAHGLIWVGVALVLVVVAAAAVVLTRAPATKEEPTIAVLPFSYGGEPQYEYLGSGMVELLSDQLGSTRGVRLVDSRAVLSATRDDDERSIDARRARAVARGLGASHFVLGSILELNGALQVSASLYDVGGRDKPVARMTLKGDVAHLFDTVNRIGAQLLADALRIESAATMPATTSLAAAEAFLEGERAYIAGQYQSAAEAFQRAVDRDSTFARAHLSLSFAANWTSQWQLERRALANAVRHQAKLSESDRLLLNAWQAHTSPRPLRADSLYAALLAREPENAEAWFQLGEVRYHWGPTFGTASESATHAFDRTLELVRGHGGALIHLLRLRARLGDTATVNSTARRVAEVGVRKQEQIEARLLSAAAANDNESFRRTLPELWEQGSPSNALASLAVNLYRMGWSTEAMRTALAVTYAEADRIYMRVLIAQMEAGRGDLRSALEEAQAIARVSQARSAETTASILLLPFFDPAPDDLRAARAALAPYLVHDRGVAPTFRDIAQPGIYHPRALLLDGLLSARLGDSAQVAGAVDRLEHLEPNGSPRRAFGLQYAALLRARVTLERGDAHQALKLLGSPAMEADENYADLLSFPLALSRWTRAEAFAKLGRTRESIRWYATFPDPAASDLMFVARSHQRRAALYDELGERSAAQAQRAAYAKLTQPRL